MFAQQSAQLDRAERERAHQLEGPESTPQVIVSEPEPVVSFFSWSPPHRSPADLILNEQVMPLAPQ